MFFYLEPKNTYIELICLILCYLLNISYALFQITSEQVLDSFIERIKKVNPVLNCVVANRFDEARKEAQEADQLIKSQRIPQETLANEKPFLGVPFTTKDCIPVKGKCVIFVFVDFIKKWNAFRR